MVRSDGAAPIIFRRADDIQTLYIEYEVDIHYESLHPTASFQEKLIKDLIEATDDDSQAANQDLPTFRLLTRQ